MDTAIQAGTYRRGYRILVLTQWAKRNNWRDPETIANHALLRFVCSPATARGYTKEVMLRLNDEQTASMLEEETKQ